MPTVSWCASGRRMTGTCASPPREPLTTRGSAATRWTSCKVGNKLCGSEHSIWHLSHSQTLKSPGARRRGPCIASLRTVEPTPSPEWLPRASLGLTQASRKAGIRGGTSPVFSRRHLVQQFFSCFGGEAAAVRFCLKCGQRAIASQVSVHARRGRGSDEVGIAVPVTLIPFSGEHPKIVSPPMISPSTQVAAITTL